MNRVHRILIILLCLCSWNISAASGDHDHEDSSRVVQDNESEKREDPDDHDEHSQNKTHASHKEKEENHGEGEREHEKNQSKTILEVEKEGKRFKLSPKAIATLGLQYSPCADLNNGNLKVPKSSLVIYGENSGLFLHDSDWFELIEVELISRNDQEYNVRFKEPIKTSASCQVVVSGVPLLRVAQLEASGEGGEGHAH